jgi:hypothetical protein
VRANIVLRSATANITLQVNASTAHAMEKNVTTVKPKIKYDNSK